jgi:hypothetical protein
MWSEHVIPFRLRSEGDRVADLHLWRVAPGHTAIIVSVVSTILTRRMPTRLGSTAYLASRT